MQGYVRQERVGHLGPEDSALPPAGAPLRAGGASPQEIPDTAGRGALATGGLWDDYDLVFCNSIGRLAEALNILCNSYVLLERAGAPHIKFHALRHSAATLLLSQRIHPKIVAEMLRHTTISMTLDIYSHVRLDMQQEAADTMDWLFRAQGVVHDSAGYARH